MGASFFLTPEVLLVLWGIVLLMYDVFSNPAPKAMAQLSMAGLMISGASLFRMWGPDEIEFWGGLYLWDGKAQFFKAFFIIAALLVTWMSMHFEVKLESGRSEFYILILFAVAGMSLLSSVQDFMLLFVALELVTITFYILVSYQRKNPVSLEAGIKYLILGGLSSAFLVMGIAYIYGFAGSTQFDSVALALRAQPISPGLIFGLMLVLVGVGFKAGAVPFHLWVPDVYQGAPLPITGFLASASKAAGFVLLLRILRGPFVNEEEAGLWVSCLVGMAMLSMVLGNLAAIPQRNIKRLMAYSGIGHAGFLMAGVAANTRPAEGMVLYYLVSYMISVLTVFLAAAVVYAKTGAEQTTALAGLSRRSPLLAFYP